jgi:excisionase family DNA binding protein
VTVRLKCSISRHLIKRSSACSVREVSKAHSSVGGHHGRPQNRATLNRTKDDLAGDTFDSAPFSIMLLTETQAAREAQVDRRTIRRLINDGRLRALDFGSGKRHYFRINPADLRAVLKRPEECSSTPPNLASRARHRHLQAATSSSVAAFLPSV